MNRKSSKQKTGVVEQMIDKKVDKNGKVHYLVKWKNHDEKDNTWEPREKLNPDLVAEFDRSHVGFKYGDEVNQILGVSDENGELVFLVQWKGREKAALVPAEEANVKCPQLVIQFYASRLHHQQEPQSK